MLVLVCRTHPAPTQTFHRRSAAALRALGVPLVRVALRGATEGPDDATTVLPRGTGGGLATFASVARRPLRTFVDAVGCVARAQRHDKSRGRLGALVAAADGARLAAFARRRGDVTRVHAQFSSWEATAALCAARALRVPFSFEVHGSYPFVGGARLLAHKVRAADAVTVSTEEARARLLGLVPDAGPRVHVVPCGVDTDDLRARAARGSEPERDVVAVGSLVPSKGHDVFVRAVGRLARDVPDLRAAIVGDGPERAALEALARAEGAPVEFLGALPEDRCLAVASRARVAALACVVAPDGDEDGVPVALLEAMALGVPVLSTPVGGVAETLEEGRAGLLAPAGDAPGFASALRRLLEDADLRARFAAAGRRAVRARHDAIDCARRLATALREPATARDAAL